MSNDDDEALYVHIEGRDSRPLRTYLRQQVEREHYGVYGKVETLSKRQDILEEFFSDLLEVLFREGALDADGLKKVLRVSAGEEVTFALGNEEDP